MRVEERSPACGRGGELPPAGRPQEGSRGNGGLARDRKICCTVYNILSLPFVPACIQFPRFFSSPMIHTSRAVATSLLLSFGALSFADPPSFPFILKRLCVRRRRRCRAIREDRANYYHSLSGGFLLWLYWWLIIQCRSSLDLTNTPRRAQWGSANGTFLIHFILYWEYDNLDLAKRVS